MGGSGRSLLMHGPFGLNGFDLMRGPFGLNGFECSWVLLGAPGELLGVRGCSRYSWGAPAPDVQKTIRRPSAFQNNHRGEVSSPHTPLRPGHLAAKVGVQFAYSHSIDKMDPKSGPSQKNPATQSYGPLWGQLKFKRIGSQLLGFTTLRPGVQSAYSHSIHKMGPKS